MLFCVASDGARISHSIYTTEAEAVLRPPSSFFRKEEVKGASSCEAGKIFRENVLRSWDIFGGFFFCNTKKGLLIFFCRQIEEPNNVNKMSKKLFVFYTKSLTEKVDIFLLLS